jgi:hypothetical protein
MNPSSKIPFTALPALLLTLGSLAAGGADGYYASKLPDGRALLLRLNGQRKEATACLHLEGEPSACLWFKTNSLERIEFANEGDNFTGLWLSRRSLPAQASGAFCQKGDTNSVPFTAVQVAETATFTRHRGLHLLSRGGGKEFRATWPDFREGVPFHQAISKLLAAEAHGQTGQFLAGSYDIIWEGLKEGGASYDWEGSLDTDIVWLGTNLVSLFQLSYEFTGGAHGNSAPIGRNFVLSGGKAREFALPDLFQPDSRWLPAVAAACLRELRRQKASWVLDDAPPAMRVKDFRAADLASFNVDGRGLLMHFGPYAVAPYAEGMFEVFIPWAELKPFLNPKGPVGRAGQSLTH